MAERQHPILSDDELLQRQFDLSYRRPQDRPRRVRQRMNITYPNPIPVRRTR